MKRVPLFCECHGVDVVAMLLEHETTGVRMVELRVKRHGRWHVRVLHLQELLSMEWPALPEGGEIRRLTSLS